MPDAGSQFPGVKGGLASEIEIVVMAVMAVPMICESIDGIACRLASISRLGVGGSGLSGSGRVGRNGPAHRWQRDDILPAHLGLDLIAPAILRVTILGEAEMHLHQPPVPIAIYRDHARGQNRIGTKQVAAQLVERYIEGTT